MENQINQLLAGQLNQFDEEALQAELNQIMGTTPVEKQPSKVASNVTPTLPTAPTHLPAIQTGAAQQEETQTSETREAAMLA